MENFFYDDSFCTDFEDLIYLLDIDDPNELKDDWSVRVETTDLEPIFKINPENFCQLLADVLADANEDRISDGFEEEPKVLKALRDSIDFDKLTQSLPKFYYPNGKFETIVKSDLIDWFS